MLGISYGEHKANAHERQQVDILAGRHELLNCQPSIIASHHGSAMYVVMTRCRRSCYKEQWMVVVAEEDLVNHGVVQHQ